MGNRFSLLHSTRKWRKLYILYFFFAAAFILFAAVFFQMHSYHVEKKEKESQLWWMARVFDEMTGNQLHTVYPQSPDYTADKSAILSGEPDYNAFYEEQEAFKSLAAVTSRNLSRYVSKMNANYYPIHPMPSSELSSITLFISTKSNPYFKRIEVTAKPASLSRSPWLHPESTSIGLSYPIYRNGMIYGYFVVSRQLSNIYWDTMQVTLKLVLILLFFGFVCALFLWLHHRKTQTKLTRFSRMVLGVETVPRNQVIKALKPALDKVDELRSHLENHRAMLETVIEQALIGVILIDQKETMVVVNPMAHRFLDVDENLTGRDVSLLAERGMNEAICLRLLAAMHDGKVFMKARIHYKSSVFSANISPIRTDGGTIIGACCVLSDITEEEARARNMQELMKRWSNESQKLQLIIESMPLGMLSVDAFGTIVSYNRQFEAYYPELGDMVGQSYRVCSDCNGELFEESVVYRCLQGEKMVEALTRIRDYTFLVNAESIRDPFGSIQGAFLFFHEITELDYLRKELIKMERLSIIGQMAASITHEIRNPLAVVRGFIQLMQKRRNSSEEQYYTIVMDELDRVNGIISDFLSLARTRVVERSLCQLNDILSSLYPIILAEANLRDLQVNLQLDEQMPELLLNENEMKQLILNLANNSMDAMESRGTLTLITRKRGQTGELLVQDTGCGMSKQVMDRLFEPFFTTKEKGTGLGLPVCQSIVEKNGGVISVDSVVEVGTVFTISFS